MKTDEKNPDDWLFLARERLQAADALFQSLGATYSGVELLQEAVERFLKAYLISRGWELQKIHNLSTLLDHAITIDERFKVHADLSENLGKLPQRGRSNGWRVKLNGENHDEGCD